MCYTPGERLKLWIPGIPKASQSTRVRLIKPKAGKPFISKYKDPKVVSYESYLEQSVAAQLPDDWTPISGAIEIERLDFVFPPLKTWNKKLLARLEAGEIIYKDTKPDLLDNLCKPFDALSGILWIDDRQIVNIKSQRKIYGFEPGIIMWIREIV